jgi:hypothetical protein
MPVVGSAYPLYRKLGARTQDLGSGPYRHMVAMFESAFGLHRPLVYSSGHDHSLQAIERKAGPRWLVVSGGGNEGGVTHVRKIDGARFAAAETGFFLLQVRASGRADLTAFVVDTKGGVREPFSAEIATGPPALP